MKKVTDFGRCLQNFLTVHMPGTIGASGATVESYRQSFLRFLEFMHQACGTEASDIRISDFTLDCVKAFLSWLESRGNGVATRNQRQAALLSFARFLTYECPDYMEEYQRILSLPFKKCLQAEISYAKQDGIKAFLEQMDRQSRKGMRDYVMFSLLYTTGMRVSELISLRAKDVSLLEPCTLLVHGKGNKCRYVPIVKHVRPALQEYLGKTGLDRPERLNDWLFTSHTRKQFTRQGINYLVSKYTKAANAVHPGILPEDFSPHKIRHSTAMGLVEEGVDLIYIRDLLGHVSVTTTEIYAKADAKHRREAIEVASKNIVPKEEAQWDNDTDLKDWLKGFNR